MEITIEERSGMNFFKISDFLNQIAKEKYNCIPPTMLEIYATAKHDQKIIACCGATIATEELHLEKIYRITDQNFLEKTLKRDVFCEIGRWVSTDASVTILVLKFLIQELQKRGVKFALCELKPATVRRAKKIGLVFHPIESVLLIEKIDPTEKLYYLSNPPDLFYLNFDEIVWQ